MAPVLCLLQHRMERHGLPSQIFGLIPLLAQLCSQWCPASALPYHLRTAGDVRNARTGFPGWALRGAGGAQALRLEGRGS